MESRTEECSITNFLGTDHHHIHSLWQDCLSAVDQRETPRVQVALKRFISHLRRHIRLEEEILFPVFEESTGMKEGPTAAMRREHLEINAALERLSRAAQQDDCDTIIAAIRAEPINPSALLANHDVKEEHALYPMADRVLSEDQRRRLILAMKAQ